MRKGFTLIEVLVTSVILSFVFFGVGSAMVLSNDIYKTTFETFIQRAQLTNSFDLIKNDIRSAARVEIAKDNNKLSIFNNSNNLICEYYSDEDGNLVKESKNGSHKLNTGKVSFSWAFESNGNSSAFISMNSNFNKNSTEKGGTSNWEKITVNCRNHVR